MAGERQSETSASAAPTASASIPEAGTGGRRDQVPLRSETAEAVTGDRDDRQGQASDESQDHSRGHGTGSAADAAEDPGEADTTAQTERPLSLDDIEGHVLRAIRYHEARGRFLDLCRRWLDFSVVLLGAGAITTATGGDSTTAGVIVGILLAGIGALQLVAGFSERANDHISLKRRFCGVLAEIVEARGEPPSERRLAKITKKWTAIWSDEPPTLHVLEAIAWNAARRSREYSIDESTLIEIPWWYSWTRNLSSWESFEPLTRAERAARVGKASDGLRWWQRPRT